MSNKVFVDNNEISCKSGSGKVVAAFPDVCMSPPSPPAGPLPIPYPVSSFSSDTTKGSRSVKVNGKEVMLKNRSYFKKCTGDEAATKAWGMGVISHQITGKVYFAAWSMDLKIEGENACRHLDITTSNHASPNPNTLTIPELENMSLPRSLKKTCKCKYNREKNAKGKPKGSRKQANSTPTSQQTAAVNKRGAKCWRRNCKTPKAGPFIADHQPSLVERWYKGGCHDKQFGNNAVSTPGTPEDNEEYHRLLPRCQNCYAKAYRNVGLRSPSGRINKEMHVESGKSRAFQRMHQERFGKRPEKC